MTGRSGSRRLRVLLLVSVCAALAVLGVVAAADGFVYYRTPTEAVQELRAGSSDAEVRVGGMVVRGSVDVEGENSVLVVTDGVTDLRVLYPGAFPDLVREGEGAVVEGSWTASGDVLAHRLLFRHSNVYRAPAAGAP